MIHDEKEATPSHRHIKRHAAFNTKSLSNQTEEEQNFYEEIERYILGVTSKINSCSGGVCSHLPSISCEVCGCVGVPVVVLRAQNQGNNFQWNIELKQQCQTSATMMEILKYLLVDNNP